MRGLVGAGVDQAKVDQVAGVQLVVLHGLGGDQDRVRLAREGVHQSAGGAALEVGVLQRGGVADVVRAHPVEVLQVGADVGEAVLDGFDAAHARHGGELGGGLRVHRGAGGDGDGDVGAVGQLRVGLGLLAVGGVEGGGGGGEGQREGEQHDGADQWSPLPRDSAGDRPGQASGERAQQPAQQRPASAEQQVGQAPGQQPGADPEQAGAGEGPVGHRDRRDAFGCEDQLVAVAAGGGEHQAGDDQQHGVQAVSRPPGIVAGADGSAAGRDGGLAQIASSRDKDGARGDEQADDGRGAGPADRGGGGGAEACGAEHGVTDQRGAGQSQRRADDADDGGLGGGQAQQLPRRGAAGAQQRLLAAAAGGAGRGDGGGQQPGQDRAGQAEEQEQHLGVGGVAAGGVQGGAEVVADQQPAGAARFEVAGRGGVGGEGAGRVGRQPVITAHVELGADQVGAGLGQRIEDLVPLRRRAAARRCPAARRAARRRGADLLEQRVGLRQVDDAGDGHRDRRESGASDRDGVAGGGVQVGRRSAGTSRTPVFEPDSAGSPAGTRRGSRPGCRARRRARWSGCCRRPSRSGRWWCRSRRAARCAHPACRAPDAAPRPGRRRAGPGPASRRRRRAPRGRSSSPSSGRGTSPARPAARPRSRCRSRRRPAGRDGGGADRRARW